LKKNETDRRNRNSLAYEWQMLFFKWWASVLKNEPEPELPPNFLQNLPEGLQMPGVNKDDKPDL